MINANLKQFSLFAENALQGIKQKGYNTKFKVLNGMTSIGRAAENMRSQLLSDVQNSEQFLNIMMSTLMEMDPLEINVEYNINTPSSLATNDFYHHVENIEESTLGEVIESLVDWIQPNLTSLQPAEKTIVVSSGKWIVLRGQRGAHGRQVWMFDGEKWLTFAQHLNIGYVGESIYFARGIVTADASSDLVPLDDLMQYILDNANLMNMCAESIVLKTNDLFAAYDVAPFINKFRSNTAAVNQAKDDLIAVSNQSGLNGVLAYIRSLYSDLNTVQESQDGLVEFSDQKNYCSVSLLSGILTLVTTTISAIVPAILHVAGIVLGILAVLFNVVANLFQSVVDMYVQTRGAIDDSIQSLPSIIYTVDQLEWGIPFDYDAENLSPIFKSMLSEKVPLLIHHGASYTILSTNGDILRIENHVDLFDRRQYITDHIQDWVQFSQNGNVGRLEIDPYALKQLLDNQSTTFTTHDYANQPDGVLSQDDDWDVTSVIAWNMMIDYLLKLCDGGFPDNQRVIITYGYGLGHPAYDPISCYDLDPSVFGTKVGLVRKVLFLFSPVAYFIDPTWPSIGYGAGSWTDIANFGIEVSTDTLDFPGVPTGSLMPYRHLNAPALLSLYDDDNNDDDLIMNLNSPFVPLVKAPKVNGQRLLSELVIIGLTAITIIGTAVVGSFLIKRKIKQVRLRNNLLVEQAWDKAKQNPDDDHIKAYIKAVKRNNRFASIFGGTKFDKAGYWNSTSDTPAADVKQVLASPTMNNLLNSNDNELTLYDIRRLIVGSN